MSALMLSCLLALAACENPRGNGLAELDNALLYNGADPALTSALEDQILTDPTLAQQAYPNQVRAPEMPRTAPYPPDSARYQATAAAQNPQSVCGAPFDFGPQWADRLPPQFPPYPGGRVTEAAGSDVGNCHMRVVTFRTADGFEQVIEYYRMLGMRAGFNAERQVRGGDHVLAGVNPGIDGAFYVIVTPLPRGTDVALIVNIGR
ncbi:MAG: hypothetical protein ACT4OE_03515 [Sphingosinicella sp.]